MNDVNKLKYNDVAGPIDLRGADTSFVERSSRKQGKYGGFYSREVKYRLAFRKSVSDITFAVEKETKTPHTQILC